MSTPLIAGPLPSWVPELARRRFRFAPAIADAGPNEWTLHRVTWDEVIVLNAATSAELSIPRRVFGPAENAEAPVGLVTLLKRLEAVDGRARPVDRQVIELRPADGPRVHAERIAEVVAIREEEAPVPRWRRSLRILVAAACLLCIVAVYVFRDAKSQARIRRFSTRPIRPASHPSGTELLIPPGRR